MIAHFPFPSQINIPLYEGESEHLFCWTARSWVLRNAGPFRRQQLKQRKLPLRHNRLNNKHLPGYVAVCGSYSLDTITMCF